MSGQFMLGATNLCLEAVQFIQLWFHCITGVMEDLCVAVKKMTLRPYDSDFMEYQYRQFEAEVNILTG